MFSSYEPVIGLEVHVQLTTRAKLFSPEAAAYGAAPNAHVDPVSLAHPGTLPVVNRRAVAQALKLGLATHCRLARRVAFARKHYVYPDLPKGYQITQVKTPLAYDGFVDLLLDDDAQRALADAFSGDGAPASATTRRVGITRIHVEEDAGKSIHDPEAGVTRLDFNRCGVPLAELVTAPDLRSPREAYLFLQKLRQLVRYLGVSDGNMEEGSLRCDANVSVRPRGHHGYGVRTEVKNLNSMRHVEEALGYEIARHVACHERGVAIEGQTLRWDAEARVTRPMRAKEGAHDYRFMPEPDLGPITISEGWREAIRAELPEMPDARRERFVREIGLPAYDAGVLTRERPVADYFEDTLAALFKRTKGGNTAAQAKAVANVVMTSVLRVLNERDDLSLDGDGFPVAPDRLAQLVFLRHQDRISSTAEQRLFQLMLDDPEASAGKLADEHDLLQVDDEQRIAPIVEAVLAEHPDKVQRYLKGKEGLKGFFVGLVRKRFDGSPKPGTVHHLLDRELEKRRGR